MARLETLTAAQILAIPPEQPERLFSGIAAHLQTEFRALAKRWHPDRNGGSSEATSVFARITALYETADRKLAAGRWEKPDVLQLTAADGRRFELRYARRREFELGDLYVARRCAAFAIDDVHAGLVKHGLRMIDTIAWPDAKVKADMAKFIPGVEGLYRAPGRDVVKIAKTDDVVLLADLIGHLGGAMPPKHVAWLVSSLLNMVCLFQAAGFAHNALATSTVFVTPKYHAAYPLGGWWYAAPLGARLELLPNETFALLTPAMATVKRVDIRLDLEAVRAIGREALGDPVGLKLAANPDVPKPMADYLRLPASGSAVEDYRAWGQALKDSFGPRRFLELPVAFSDVYG